MENYNLTTTDVTGILNNSTNATRVPGEVSWVYWLPGPLICSFGIICNLLNLSILLQKELRDSPYSFLTALAYSDLSLLVLSLVHLTTSTAANTYIKAAFNTYVFFPIGNVFFNASVWIVVALTVERMFFVIRPLTTHSSRRKAWVTSSLIFISCFIMNIPRFFCFTVFKLQGQYYPKATSFRGSTEYYIICWCHAVVINFIPLTILLVSNSALIYTLHKSAEQRKYLRSNRDEANHKDQQRLTRTLVVVVITFFICTIPSAFVDDPIAHSLFGQGRSWSEYLSSPSNQMLIYISNLLLFLNSSLNFVLYCAFNQRFRKVAKRVFWKVQYRGRGALMHFSDGSHRQTMYTGSETQSSKL